MRRILVHLDVDIIKHDESFLLDDELLERNVGEMVGQTLPRRLGIGTTPIQVPDGRGGFIPKPAVLVVVRHVGIEALPEADTQPMNGTAPHPKLDDQPPPSNLRILTP